MRTALLTASVLLVPTFLGPAAAGAEASPAPVCQTPEDKEFRTKFQQAMKIGAKDELKKLVDRQTDQAVTWIIQTAESIANAPNDTLFERMTAAFCDKMERYFSLLDPTIRRERIRMRGDFDKQVGEYWANAEKKDGSTYFKLSGEIGALADAFVEIGDHYYASQCWNLVGHCNDETLRSSKDADLKKACRAFRMCLEERDKIGLRDTIYVTTKPRVDQLIALGYGPSSNSGEPGVPGAPDAGPAGELGNSVAVELSFDLVDEIGAILRPSFFLDDLYPTWNSISLADKGSKVLIPRLEEGPSVHRVGAAKVSVDVDKDGDAEGKADVEIPVRGRLEPVVFDVGDGDAKRKMAFLAVTGNERDSYQKIEMNLAPFDTQITIYITPAGSMVGEIDGTPIRILDDDLNGVYGSVPSLWGHVGMTKDHYQPEIDSLVIGKSKRAVPFSEHIQIGDKWYRLEVENGGTSLVAHPMRITTGTMVLSAKGLKPDFLLVRGENQYENTFFDLAADKKVEVPVGRYKLYFGVVHKGKKKQMMKALIIPGEGSGHYDVLAGEEIDVEIGAPYGFDFEASVDDSSVLVVGKSVVVVGRGGERYERVWNAVPRPDVTVRKAGSKRGSKPETMDLVMDQQAIYDTGDWAVAWFPRDIEVVNKAGDDAEVQLVEKKNKLFGKIESVWK
jgi:hypothetical protein